MMQKNQYSINIQILIVALMSVERKKAIHSPNKHYIMDIVVLIFSPSGVEQSPAYSSNQTLI